MFTDLRVNHVTNSHSDLHARSLDVIVVEVLENAQAEGREGHRRSVTIHHDKTSLVIWIIILKVLDYFPEKQRLDHFNYFLNDTKEREKMKATRSSTLWLEVKKYNPTHN